MPGRIGRIRVEQEPAILECRLTAIFTHATVLLTILAHSWAAWMRRLTLGARTLVAQRHLHRQEPCRQCWARYLCGGGCHHEVIHRGRPACHYIRGWLHYCIQAYVHLRASAPNYFAAGQA